MQSAALNPTACLLGFAILHATAGRPVEMRESASLATFLFGVIGVLLILFFAVVLLTTVSRALRRKQAMKNEPTDMSVDAWEEAGKRMDRPSARETEE